MLELDTDKRITAEQAISNNQNQTTPISRQLENVATNSSCQLIRSLMHALFSLRSRFDKLDEQALAHPYLAQYADPTDEPASLPYDQVHCLKFELNLYFLRPGAFPQI